MKRPSLFARAVAAALIFATVAFAPLARAASMTDYLENKLIDLYFRGQAFTAPTVLAVGLMTAVTSCDAGTVTEVSNTGTAYARQALNPALANWAGTQSAGSTTASTGTSGTTSNNSVITFPTATASWGTVNYFGIWDSATYGAGNLLFCAAVTTPQTIGSGATPSFGAGTLTIQIDN